ncbi:hypothetical protein CCACVL1_09580 [Corchorus capsularis]|uniref:Uncharacterized protein n=1 Tax=Corchorus capsularis TaxID=210143 RepID=A0A1R3IVA8_COCAP|nr:hypothetical protein CCACVL1_09580 [Corchorus capsularis]
MASTLDKARLWFLSVAAKFRSNFPSIPKSPGGAKTNKTNYINRKILQGKKVENSNKVMGARNDCGAVEMYFTDSLLNHKPRSEPVDENNHKVELDSKPTVGSAGVTSTTPITSGDHCGGASQD